MTGIHRRGFLIAFGAAAIAAHPMARAFAATETGTIERVRAALAGIEGLRGEVWFDPNPPWTHVTAQFLGRNLEDARRAPGIVLDTLAKGRRTLIRCVPAAFSQLDFTTDEWSYKGYVRFAFQDEPGEWEYPRQFEDGALVGVAMQ